MSDKPLYCNNAMLNLPGFNSTAALSIKIELGDDNHYGKKDKEYKPSLSGTLDISDCNRAISLDLYANDKEAYANIMYKLKTILDNVSAAYSQLQSKQERFNTQWDRVDEREKQEKLDKQDK